MLLTVYMPAHPRTILAQVFVQRPVWFLGPRWLETSAEQPVGLPRAASPGGPCRPDRPRTACTASALALCCAPKHVFIARTSWRKSTNRLSAVVLHLGVLRAGPAALRLCRRHCLHAGLRSSHSHRLRELRGERLLHRIAPRPAFLATSRWVSSEVGPSKGQRSVGPSGVLGRGQLELVIACSCTPIGVYLLLTADA